MTNYVPPGGYVGFAQMTPASRAALTTTRGSTGRRRKRKSTRRASTKGRARARKTSKRKLKFGSPAWQKKYHVGKYAKSKR